MEAMKHASEGIHPLFDFFPLFFSENKFVLITWKIKREEDITKFSVTGERISENAWFILITE